MGLCVRGGSRSTTIRVLLISPSSSLNLTLNISLLLFSDPFADAIKGDDKLPAGTDDYIHIRIQQRNGRKTLTTVQGIAADYDKKKLVKAFKKVLFLQRFPTFPYVG